MTAPNKILKHDRLINTVKQAIATYNMFQPGDMVLVGVSGGPDSTALIHVLLSLAPALSISLGIAHFNHGLRHKDSDSEADFAAEVAKSLALPFYSIKRDTKTYQLTHRLSLEEAARELRYAFFYDTAQINGYNKIALGHHQHDNAESILMYLLRGSGRTGASGIPAVRDGKVVRPLIMSSKTQINEFITHNRLKYVTDISNTDKKLLRNKIRHELIPILKDGYNPKIIGTLNRLGTILNDENRWMEEILDPLYDQAVLKKQPEKLVLSIAVLNEIHTAAKRRLIRKAVKGVKGDLKSITFSHIESVIGLAASSGSAGSLDLPHRILIKKSGGKLVITKEKQSLRSLNDKNKILSPPPFTYNVFRPEAALEKLVVKEAGLCLTFCLKRAEDLPDIRDWNNSVAYIDTDKIKFPLVIRNLIPGDRFWPLGMTGTQKISRFLINSKIPRCDRIKSPVLLSGKRIIWVVGLRIDDSVKITPTTENVLKMELFLA